MYNNELYHYGTPRHSGRYPWGSGENPYQRQQDFLSEYRRLKGKGLSEKEIADFMNCSMKELRDRNTAASEAERLYRNNYILKLKDKGMSNSAIARQLDINESVVRSALKQVEENNQQSVQSTVQMLKRELDEKKYLDVGKFVERDLNIPRKKLDAALQYMKDEGYTLETIMIPQATMKNQTTNILTLANPGTKKDEIYKNIDGIESITAFSGNGGSSWQTSLYPSSIDSKRIQVKYYEDGGVKKDGVIELRRGMKDLNLGNSLYSQVRIAVDGTHYIKGMAVYRDDMPDGVDIIINSNKHVGTPLKGSKDNSVLKTLKSDKKMPFGATIEARGQSFYEDDKGLYILDKNGTYREATKNDPSSEKRYSLNAVNKVNDQGNWSEWSKSLSSQFLSKQDIGLIKRQLNLAYAEKADEYDLIVNLENPEVKKTLLWAFASGCDSSAVDLKAAALPRQQSHVIIPVNSLKDNEIYAPNYKDGEHVCLVRYPHAGTFEIPELVVNNRNREARSVLGTNTVDAVGINSNVAERLSGADFDGDTVLVIPTNDRVKIKTTPPLKALEGFDPKEAYRGYEGMKVMSNRTKQQEMGKVSNLITDMTLMGADNDEIARAVKHSMVVIDAEKHELDWKRSELENGIRELKIKYQGVSKNGQPKGASTIISKASSEAVVNERKQNWRPDPETGELTFTETGRAYPVQKFHYEYYKDSKGKDVKKKVFEFDDDGKPVYKTDKDGNIVMKSATSNTNKMSTVTDAYELTQYKDPALNNPKENVYADYANKLKALANSARKEYMGTESEKRDPVAAKEYASEVESLTMKLEKAQANAPKERQAQVIAATRMRDLLQEDPLMDKDHKKKYANQALAEARLQVGASKSDVSVVIEPKEWEAIQAHAVSPTTLREILKNTDLDVVKSYATPRDDRTLTDTQQQRIKAYATSGYTNEQIAEMLNISASTVGKYLNE